MDFQNQPSILGVLQLIEQEFAPSAILILHKTGQIIQRLGSMDDGNFPALGALVAAMASAGKSISKLDPPNGAEEGDGISQFYCESKYSSLYAVAISEDHWLAVYGDHPRNPGLYRMKIRRSGKILENLSVAETDLWQSGAEDHDERNASSNSRASVTLSPHRETKSSLFENITDDEIEDLFIDAKS